MRTVSKLGLAGLRLLGCMAGRLPSWRKSTMSTLPYNINVLTQATARFASETNPALDARRRPSAGTEAGSRSPCRPFRIAWSIPPKPTSSSSAAWKSRHPAVRGSAKVPGEEAASAGPPAGRLPAHYRGKTTKPGIPAGIEKPWQAAEQPCLAYKGDIFPPENRTCASAFSFPGCGRAAQS